MKKVLAFILCFAVALSLTACSDSKETPNSGNKGSSITDKDLDKITESDLESKLNELDGSKNSKPEQSAVEPAPEEYIIAMTDEIKNADFGSGLVQLNNEVFQQGGYVTVDDFVKQYEGLYDITYNQDQDGTLTYDGFKDYLVAYKEYKNKTISYGVNSKLSSYYLILTPKQGAGVKNRQIRAYIANATSPDEKIAVSEAIVLGMGINPYTYSNGSSDDSRLPAWAPGGLIANGKYFNDNDYHWEATEGLESANEEYTVTSVKALLEESGYTAKEYSGVFYVNKDRRKYMFSSYSNSVMFFAEGEKNLFGTIPLYEYTFSFNPNTDKLEYINYQIAAFVIE